MAKDQIDEIINLIFEAKKMMHDDSHANSLKYSPLHLRTLHFIFEHPSTGMKDVADLLCVTPPSATSLVEGMVKSNLILRSESKTDRRIVELKLTKKGQNLLKKGFEHFKKKIRKILNLLTSQERKVLIDIIIKISKWNEKIS